MNEREKGDYKDIANNFLYKYAREDIQIPTKEPETKGKFLWQSPCILGRILKTKRNPKKNL